MWERVMRSVKRRSFEDPGLTSIPSMVYPEHEIGMFLKKFTLELRDVRLFVTLRRGLPIQPFPSKAAAKKSIR